MSSPDFGHLEKQLFTWESWDSQDINSFTFYKPKLVVSLGEFPAGTSFDVAHWVGERSILQLENDERDGKPREFWIFRLKVTAELIDL